MSNQKAVAKRFPEGFVWGAATAAHQVEGGNHNSDCWAMEMVSPSIFREPSGDAVDQWHRFDDDMAVLAALGLKAYRFSVEWARIEPQPGAFSVVALDHYQRCIDACLQRGIAPVLTFHHFTLPLWVARKGGFNSPEFADLFGNYCAKVSRRLRGFATACTINELNVPILVRRLVQSAFMGPEARAKREAAERALGAPITSAFLFTPPEILVNHGLAAHRQGRDAIKAEQSHVQVGITLSIQDEQAEPGAERVRDERLAEYVTPFLDGVRGDDFIGVQTYTRSVAKPDGTSGPAPGHPLTMMGYEDRPQAVAEVCRYVWEKTRTPIIVTESGWAGADDSRRCEFVTEAIAALHDVLAEGVPLRGYYYWSLLDNFEWLAGYGPKFGLIAVDRATQQRTIKPSALVYGRIAQDNAVTQMGTVVPPTAKTADDGDRLGGVPLGVA
jgi:beta-glucosidase